MATVQTYEFSQLDGDIAATRVEDVLSAAWAEAEQVRARARAEGFEAGRAEGRVAFADEAAPALAALAGAASALESLADASVATLQEQAAELALAIAEQILSGAVEVDPSRVVDICRGALRRLSDRARVTLVVHPADLEAVSARGDELVSALGGIERFEVQADRRMERGGVVVRTEHGEIDATIATQLGQARELVAEALRSGAASAAGSADDEEAGRFGLSEEDKFDPHVEIVSGQVMSVDHDT